MSDSFKPTILVAPNAFKDSLTAPQICDYFNSLLSGRYRVISLPAGDGGDGTAEIIASYFPLPRPVYFRQSMLWNGLSGELITAAGKPPSLNWPVYVA